jgi:mannosyltransferase
MTAAANRRIDDSLVYLRVALLVLFLGRVWLMAMPSGLWVDELVTIFVVRHPGDASFAIAPQVPESLYYWLPKISLRLFGDSEAMVRLPSVLAMGAALFFIARVAVRLVHPDAAWFAVFACLAFRNFDYFAIDARPYALGIAVSSAGVLFLIRWFDSARWQDEAVFVALAASLWYVHLFYWPFYLVYAVYAGVRLARRETQVGALQLVVAAAVLTAALAPVALTALRISGNAEAHTFNPEPTLRNLFYMLHLPPLLIAAAAGWGLRRFPGLKRQGVLPASALTLILCWWLVCPVVLFLYSQISGNGVLIMRYVSLMLPGIGLLTTALAGYFLPVEWWKPAALAVGLAALAFLGQWSELWPAHDHDRWRDAAIVERASADRDTPVLCPSPFIEAQRPVWNPDYRLPGFLYAHLTYYPLNGRLKLFPFKPTAESEAYLGSLVGTSLIPSGRFVLYGSTWSVRKLDMWLAGTGKFSGGRKEWRKEWHTFDNISVVVYRSPGKNE